MAGMYDEGYDMKDVHSRAGTLLSFGGSFLLICFIGDPFRGLIVSQAVLSLQLPFTMFLQVGLTSSRRVMGNYANRPSTKLLLYGLAGLVAALNVYLLWQLLASN